MPRANLLCWHIRCYSPLHSIALFGGIKDTETELRAMFDPQIRVSGRFTSVKIFGYLFFVRISLDMSATKCKRLISGVQSIAKCTSNDGRCQSEAKCNRRNLLDAKSPRLNYLNSGKMVVWQIW